MMKLYRTSVRRNQGVNNKIMMNTIDFKIKTNNFNKNVTLCIFFMGDDKSDIKSLTLSVNTLNTSLYVYLPTNTFS